MSNPWFQFKQFTVRHDLCAMKVGTDGTLLGAWVDVSGAKTILDVGTGSGLIALMLAQRSEDALIDAIDTDENACRQSEMNFALSPFVSRLRVVHGNFLHYFPLKACDLIVSNPPYFIDSLKSPDKQRTIARHTDELPLNGLLEKSAQLLTAGGRLSLILPAERFGFVQDAAARTGFFLVRKTEVCAVENRPPKRVLLEYARTFAPLAENKICIETAHHTYSEEYRALTKDFYLKM